MANFNKLTPGQAERLAALAEEAGSVVHAIGKILKHGYESYDPTDKNSPSNRERLEQKLGHLDSVICLLAAAEDVDADKVFGYVKEKVASLEKYSHHQNEVTK